MSKPVLGGKAFFAPDLQYVTSSRTNMRDVAHSHLVANVTLSSNSLIKDAEISLSVNNLFNSVYYVNAQPQDVQDLMVQPARSVQFQFTYHL